MDWWRGGGIRCKEEAFRQSTSSARSFKQIFMATLVTHLGRWLLLAGLIAQGIGGLPLPARAGEEGPDWLPEVVFAPVAVDDIKRGFNLRADTWEGELPVGETKPIKQQFFKGNDYHFYVTTPVAGAAVSLHIYDQDGNLAESRAWKKEDNNTFFAGADIRPSTTGSYYLILKVDRSPDARTPWSMGYAYK